MKHGSPWSKRRFIPVRHFLARHRTRRLALRTYRRLVALTLISAATLLVLVSITRVLSFVLEFHLDIFLLFSYGLILEK